MIHEVGACEVWMRETRPSILCMAVCAFVMTTSLAAEQTTPSENRSTAATQADPQRWPPLLRDPTVPLVRTRLTEEVTDSLNPPLCGRRMSGFDHAAYQLLCKALQSDRPLSGIRRGSSPSPE